MSTMEKGIACRICKHNEDGKCVQGEKLPVYKPHDCWYFQNRKANSGLAVHAASTGEWY